MNPSDGIAAVVGFFVYEIIVNAIFYRLQDSLAPSVGGLPTWIFLWLISAGGPPVGALVLSILDS